MESVLHTAASLPDPSFYQHPPAFNKLQQKILSLSSQYAALKSFSIGRSVLGRKIYALGLGDLRNAVLFAAAFHGQEWLTTLLCVRFVEELCRALQNKQPLFGIQPEHIFDGRGLIVLPMVNPDGVEIALHGAASAKRLKKQVEAIMRKDPRSWQANACGVDLNHNFDAGFSILRQMEEEAGIHGPSPRQYGGPRPHSEPETRAVASLCMGFGIRRVLAFHSQGEEIYYSYGDRTPENAKIIADAMAASSGYRVCVPDGLASHGGFKDWFIEKFGRPGFTIEIGKGENPLPVQDLEPIYARLFEMMLLSILI
ncbi:MAG TPA: M14 family metallocarboxypeptidase [Firmicutes bacterium]|nr:M14 family metallocarboxypeptidase [Bacillota bacterium]